MAAPEKIPRDMEIKRRKKRLETRNKDNNEEEK